MGVTVGGRRAYVAGPTLERSGDQWLLAGVPNYVASEAGDTTAHAARDSVVGVLWSSRDMAPALVGKPSGDYLHSMDAIGDGRGGWWVAMMVQSEASSRPGGGSPEGLVVGRFDGSWSELEVLSIPPGFDIGDSDRPVLVRNGDGPVLLVGLGPASRILEYRLGPQGWGATRVVLDDADAADPYSSPTGVADFSAAIDAEGGTEIAAWTSGPVLLSRDSPDGWSARETGPPIEGGWISDLAYRSTPGPRTVSWIRDGTDLVARIEGLGPTETWTDHVVARTGSGEERLRAFGLSMEGRAFWLVERSSTAGPSLEVYGVDDGRPFLGATVGSPFLVLDAAAMADEGRLLLVGATPSQALTPPPFVTSIVVAEFECLGRWSGEGS